MSLVRINTGFAKGREATVLGRVPGTNSIFNLKFDGSGSEYSYHESELDRLPECDKVDEAVRVTRVNAFSWKAYLQILDYRLSV